MHPDPTRPDHAGCESSDLFQATAAADDRPRDRSVLDLAAAGARRNVTSGVRRIRDEVGAVVRPRAWVRARPLLSVFGVFGATTVLTASLAPARRPKAREGVSPATEECGTAREAAASSHDSRPPSFAVRTLFALGTAAARHLIEQRVAARAEVPSE